MAALPCCRQTLALSLHSPRLCAQREGLGGFYKGLAPNVLRVMPQSALTFLVYESVMRLLADGQAQQVQQAQRAAAAAR